uniref:Uncharacterized protein n=1 Tax=Arundo donax TaxID=35708 RepID=A0A0A9B2M9_ARUDO
MLHHVPNLNVGDMKCHIHLAFSDLLLSILDLCINFLV